MRAAVAGGTGLVGTLVAAELDRRGIEAVVLARSRGVDLVTGAGLDEALVGARVVVDVSNVTATRARTSVAFFTAATTQLLAAAARAGARHVATLSIVGADTIDLGYYLGKRRQEELLAAGPVPWTLLRSTQFHEFPAQLLARVPGPVVPVPVMASQPVAAREVATHLVDLALGPPQQVALPMAGPDRLWVPDMTRRLLAAQGSRRLVLPLRLPGRVGAELVGGGLVPREPCLTGTVSFAEHLAGLGRP